MTKNTYEANILCSQTFKYFKNTHFFRIIHLRPPSPKRPVAEMAALNYPRPYFWYCQVFAWVWTLLKAFFISLTFSLWPGNA